MQMSQESQTPGDLFRRTFFPYAAAARERMLRDQTRIVYYTSAATAMQILRNREIWMRNTQVMNDFLEVDHGISCVQRALATEAGRSEVAPLV